MLKEDIYQADTSFFSRLKFLFVGDEALALIVRKERHKYFRLGRMCQTKSVVNSMLDVNYKLEKFTKKIDIRTHPNPNDLEIGISFRLDNYMGGF